MSINAINTTILGISKKQNIKIETQKEKNDETTTLQNNLQPKIQVSSDNVFKFMSANSIMPVQSKKSVNVSNYTNSESASRISSSMKDFENQFNAKFSTVKSEFGNISDSLAEKITLSMF